LDRLKSAGIEGPVFVSVGTPEKLSIFLDNNPDVPRDRVFVDSSEEFDAYRAAGFGNIGDEKPRVGVVKPNLNTKQWLSYFSNVGKVAPKFEGVKRLGGSFVVRNGKAIFEHSDSVPGDEAPVEDLIAAASA
jgi:hypothetical protein